MCPKKANASSARRKDYYTQLLEDFKILDFVKNFTKDFTFHDKKYFDEIGNTFPFILGIRETGTNIEDLAQSQRILHEDHSKLLLIEDHFKYWIINPNQRWFFGNNGEIREIPKEEAEKVFRQYVDEAMARKPITEPTKIWVTAKFNLGKAIETYLRDYIEELQMGSLRIDEKTEDHLINRYLKEAYQRDLDSDFSPAEQKEMQKIFAYDPEFSKTMKKIFPSAKIRKDIIPMLKAPVEVSADAGDWIVERLNASSISVRGREMQYLIIQHPTGIHLQGIYPNGMLRTFDEPKKRANQKFTKPIEFTPATLSQTLIAEGVPPATIVSITHELIPSTMTGEFSDGAKIKKVSINISDIPMVMETADGQPAIRAKDLAKFNRVMQGGDLSRAEKIEQSKLDLEQIKLILSEHGRYDLWEILIWILEEDKQFNLFDIHVRDNFVNIYDALIQNSDIASASKTMTFEDIQASLKMLRLPLFASQEEAERLYWKRLTWQDFIDSKFGKIESEIEIKESDSKK